MMTSNYPALFAALLALGACAKSDEGATDTDTAGMTTTATTTAATMATTAATHGDEGSSGEATHATHSGSEASATDATTSTPTTGEATTGPEATTGSETDLCGDYCVSISANCTGEHAQYGTPQTCLATCAAFLPGTPADTVGNTLGCRTYHAGAAAADPVTHCTHAGPGGAGVCGDNCEGFCAIAGHACPDAWPDDAACQTACGTFSPDESYDATDVAGNTFACRLYHATAAALDPVTHCGHIKGDSAPCM